MVGSRTSGARRRGERSRHLALLAVVVAISVDAGIEHEARAEAAPSGSDEAVALFVAGDYQAALDRFLQLREAQPSAEVDYGVAWCLSRLGRESEALAAFDEYLARWPGDQPERTARAREEAARIRAAVIGQPAPASPQPAPAEPAPPASNPWLEEAPQSAGEPVASQDAAVLEPPAPEAVVQEGSHRRLARARSSPFGWLELGLELAYASRRFEVPIDPNCDVDGRTNALFTSSAYPSMGFRASFFPGAIVTRRWPSGFGVEGAVSFPLYLQIVNQRRNDEVDASHYLAEVGAVYRHVWGDADLGATLRARFGFTHFEFILSDFGNDIVPPVIYDAIHLGASAYLPFRTRFVGLEIGASYLAVINVGNEMVEAYNASGELPTAHGYQVSAVLSGQIRRGLRWYSGVELIGFVSEHSGKGHGWGADVLDNPSTLCTSLECLESRGCVDTTTPERTPIEGGIYTTDSANDLSWRVIFGFSYRFGWDPDRAAQ